MKSLIPILIIVLTAIQFAEAQIYVRQIGNVAYGGSGADSIRMDDLANTINNFISTSYPKKKLPLIYIGIGNTKVLAFDNLKGNSLTNKKLMKETLNTISLEFALLFQYPRKLLRMTF